MEKNGLWVPPQRDILPLQGFYNVRFTHRRTGRLIKKIVGRNLIVNSGKALLGDMLIDRSGYDTGLTVCAIGTDNTEPNDNDTTLGTEAARKAITTRVRVGLSVQLTTYLAYSECSYAIEEAGIFGHSTAQAGTPDSGELFSRWLLSFDNSGGEADMTIDYMLPVSGGSTKEMIEMFFSHN